MSPRHEKFSKPGRRRFILLRLIFVPVFLFLGAWILKLLWNAIAPVAFGGGILTYWETLGLMIIARILVGGRGGFGGRPPFGSRTRSRDAWKAHMMEAYGRGYGGGSGKDFHRHGGSKDFERKKAEGYSGGDDSVESSEEKNPES